MRNNCELPERGGRVELKTSCISYLVHCFGRALNEIIVGIKAKWLQFMNQIYERERENWSVVDRIAMLRGLCNFLRLAETG